MRFPGGCEVGGGFGVTLEEGAAMVAEGAADAATVWVGAVAGVLGVGCTVGGGAIRFPGGCSVGGGAMRFPGGWSSLPHAT
jgi:hypothetical protein